MKNILLVKFTYLFNLFTYSLTLKKMFLFVQYVIFIEFDVSRFIYFAGLVARK